MIINFRICRINLNMYRLVWIFILIKKKTEKKLYISVKLMFGTFCIPSQRTCIQAWLIRAYSKGGKCVVFLWSRDIDFTGILNSLVNVFFL